MSYSLKQFLRAAAAVVWSIFFWEYTRPYELHAYLI